MYLSLHYTDTVHFLYGPNVKQLKNDVGYFGSNMAISFSAYVVNQYIYKGTCSQFTLHIVN